MARTEIMLDTTAVIVSYNRADLLRRAVESLRKFYPELPIIIIDGSDPDHECHEYVATLENDRTEVIRAKRNVGHGRGMEMGIKAARTQYVLLMDSDVEVQKPCLESMVAFQAPNVFGCGMIVAVNSDGSNVGEDYPNPIPYLHPHFALINRENYLKVPGFVHHGAPCIRTMQHLQTFGKQRLIEFPVGKFIYHEGRGTRSLNPEGFLKGWE